MLSEKELKQRRQETAWNHQLLGNDPGFKALTSMRRAYVSEGMPLVLWTVAYGQPILKARYRVTEIIGGHRHGFTVRLQREGAGVGPEEFNLCHIPRQLPESSCFAWVPRHIDARYIPANPTDIHSSVKLTLSVMFGGRAPIHHLVEGADYLTYPSDLILAQNGQEAEAHA